MVSEITALGSGITDHGISSIFRDQVLGCTIFVGSGTKINLAFGIKDQKFVYTENGISDEKKNLVTTLDTVRYYYNWWGGNSA